MQEVRTRCFIQRPDGKNLEIDLIADSDHNQRLLVEVKNTQAKIGIKKVEDFWEKAQRFAQINEGGIVIPAFLSLGGFTAEAETFCQNQGIGLSTELAFLEEEFKNLL